MPHTYSHQEIEEMLKGWDRFHKDEPKGYQPETDLEKEFILIIRQLLDESIAKEAPNYPVVTEAYTEYVEAWRNGARVPRDNINMMGGALNKAVEGSIKEEVTQFKKEMKKEIELIKANGEYISEDGVELISKSEVLALFTEK